LVKIQIVRKGTVEITYNGGIWFCSHQQAKWPDLSPTEITLRVKSAP